MEAEEQGDSLDEEEAAIAMEIAKVMEKGRTDRSPTLRNVQRRNY